MRKPLIFGLAFGFAAFASLSPRAESHDLRWEVLAEDERAIIDRLAADFYEDALRRSQTAVIEDRTSELYTKASPVERARFRMERRNEWRSMTDAQREALKNAKRPSYRNLTEEQKAPFRRIAFDKLGAAGAIDPDALASAFKNDI